ncbi:hypothetical protein [Blastococcus sp. CCUG 61487]|uniref:DUF7660 family protein n=1 Tax=Blastococcus sp. CCUG 61487 TaxID=1840703 RepID=UPI0010C00B42|nr:hypothetical protein [Blastococcus sp. CCUG 61487]
MEIDDAIRNVSDAQSLANFLGQLRADDAVHAIASLDDFLEQMQAFVVDAGSGPLAAYATLPEKAWRLVAELLFAAAVYE